MPPSPTQSATKEEIMDRVRVFETTLEGRSEQAELFPDISIGDVPQ